MVTMTPWGTFFAQAKASSIAILLFVHLKLPAFQKVLAKKMPAPMPASAITKLRMGFKMVPFTIVFGAIRLYRC
jgi:hypothetical protein